MKSKLSSSEVVCREVCSMHGHSIYDDGKEFGDKFCIKCGMTLPEIRDKSAKRKS